MSQPQRTRVPTLFLIKHHPHLCPHHHASIAPKVWSANPWSVLLRHCFLSHFGDICADNRRRQWHPTPVLLPGKSRGRRSLVGCSPWGCEEWDMTERLHFHFSLSCIEEGNGNPLQWSCLENPRDCGAWWAAVYGVAQSRTRVKQLSSSSSRTDDTKAAVSKTVAA